MRIVLIDDHAIVRKGLRVLLEGMGDAEIVGEAADGQAGVELVREQRPQLVIMDISMPLLNGIDATRRIREEAPEVAIIALSVRTDPRSAAEFLRAGGSGYVSTDCAFEELEEAIRQIMLGHTYISPGMTGSIVDTYVRSANDAGQQPDRPGAFSVLSEREREVLQMLAEGLNTKQIALRMGISPKTVQTFRCRMMAKLGIDNVAELTKYAITEGLISFHS
jgi:DNA-binding NarL/FixJ family response regulator